MVSCWTSYRAVRVGVLGHGASLHPGVYIGTGEFNAGVTLQWTSIPSRGEKKYS